MLVLRLGGQRLGASYLPEQIFVSLEPVPCSSHFYRASTWLYFGAFDPKGRALITAPRFLLRAPASHVPEVYGGIEEKPARRCCVHFSLSGDNFYVPLPIPTCARCFLPSFVILLIKSKV